jgi:adenosylcobinamide-GDP ribazoletransferase
MAMEPIHRAHQPLPGDSDGSRRDPEPAAAASHRSQPPAWLRDLAGAWIFYSVLPAWPGLTPRFLRIARFAPWIGAVLGGLQGLLWWRLQGQAPPLAQVCLVLAAGLWLSGGLHMDGAMDTADGLAAGERLLEAMADSRVGASGVQAMVLVLLLRSAALAWLGPLAPLALVWAAVWGRLAPLIAMAHFPYLRERGSAAFHRRHWAGLTVELRPGLLLLLALALLTWSLRGAEVLSLGRALLGLLPALLVPVALGRRLGGHSGDSYGACVEWSESLALLLMAALPLGAMRG